MEIGAVSALVRACPDRITAAPTRAVLVVGHRAVDVVVERLDLLVVGRATLTLLARDVGDEARERHQAIRLLVERRTQRSAKRRALERHPDRRATFDAKAH